MSASHWVKDVDFPKPLDPPSHPSLNYPAPTQLMYRNPPNWEWDYGIDVGRIGKRFLCTNIMLGAFEGRMLRL